MASAVTVFIVAVACVLGYYVATHVRPLNAAEIERLAVSRRATAWRCYFYFRSQRAAIDRDFKRSMQAAGTFHSVAYPLCDGPAIIASHLKHKKHEWIVFAFETNRQIVLLWANKGLNGMSVSPHIDHDHACRVARRHRCSSLLRLHNHPNPDPRRYRALLPSQQDHRSSEHLAAECQRHGLNFIDIVCERGFFRVFKTADHASFLPVSDFRQGVVAENGKSRYKNLRLHLERHFSHAE
jgi:hypothetical protein